MGSEADEANSQSSTVVVVPGFKVGPRYIGVFKAWVLTEGHRKCKTCAIRVVAPGIKTAKQNTDIRVAGRQLERYPAFLYSCGILAIYKCFMARLPDKVIGGVAGLGPGNDRHGQRS